ncbi:MAG: hypothetical protein EBU93_07270, partial [Chlamydiae bacterium]|nr:hypothetical protein [Chlamydiota bacterium]
FFTRVKYKFPSDADDFYRYQAFYQSSGTNTRLEGVWFPCDGLVLYLDRGKRIGSIGVEPVYKIIFGWICKVSYTMSAKQLYNRQQQLPRQQQQQLSKQLETCKRFGSPIFVFISRHLQLVHPLSQSIQNLSQKFTKIMEGFQVMEPEYESQSLRQKRIPKIICHKIPDDKDPDEYINRFIGDAVSINWLYDIPPSISRFENEYDTEIQRIPQKLLIHEKKINLNDLQNGEPLQIHLATFNGKKIFMEEQPFYVDGKIWIPDYLLNGTNVSFWAGMRKKIITCLPANKRLETQKQRIGFQEKMEGGAETLSSAPQIRTLQQKTEASGTLSGKRGRQSISEKEQEPEKKKMTRRTSERLKNKKI